jgi:hypothetical protein
MKGIALIPALKTALCDEGTKASDSALARALEYTQANISGIARKNMTPMIVANVVKRAANAAKSSLSRDWIKTLVEFYPVHRTDSRQGAKWEILDKEQEKQRPLYQLLRETKRGLYSFYNSEGSIIYLGKTKNELWYEMNGAFNRNMESHEVWTVAHPASRAFTQTMRRIRRTNVHLYDTARFFSAYAVDGGFVDRLEALFIRILPNNLTNVRIEGQTERSVEQPRVGRRKHK